MTTSIVFARFIGPVMLVAAVSMLLDRKAIRAVGEDFMNSPALIYLAGVLMLIMGIAITTFHNIWVMDWRIIITLFGCIGIVGGIMRMAFPMLAIEIGKRMMGQKKMLAVIAIINTALGAFLTYKGYMA